MNNITNYDVLLRLGDHDISSFLQKFRIFSDMRNSYCSVILELKMDFKYYYIDNNFLGKNELVFQLKNKNIENQTIDTMGFILGIVESTFSLINQKVDAYQTTEHNAIDQLVVLYTVPLLAVNKMGASVNYVSESKEEKTAYETVRDVISNAGLDTQMVDGRGMNQQILRQVCIPPMSINKMIPYMNHHFGIYDGPLFYYCDFYGQVQMWNLKEKYKDNPSFVIHQFSVDKEGEDQISDKILKEVGDLTKKAGHYMCVEPIDIIKNANADVIEYGYHHINISHPPYDLYASSTMNAKELIEDTGIYGKERNVTSHDLLNVLKRYNTINSSESVDESFIKANQASKYLAISPIRVKIRGYCRFSFMVNIGTPVELIVYTLAYKKFSGKYILAKSAIDIERKTSSEWNTSTSLILYRSV